MKIKKIFPVICLLMATVSIHAQKLPNITDPRVSIKLPDANGDSLTLESYKGKVILLDFWASWCGPCRYANKKLVKIYDKLKGKDFVIFSVSLDTEKKSWIKAIAKDRITWTQVIDPGGWDAQTAARWNIFQLPTTYLINKNGDVVEVDPDEAGLEQKVNKLLGE